MDEIPFDFNRKRLSVVVRRGDEHLLITKGEAESVFAICQTVIIDGAPQPFDESRRAQAAETFQKLSADGYPHAWGRRPEGGRSRMPTRWRPSRT